MKRSDASPIVSVIVPNFNHGAFLGERLEADALLLLSNAVH